jgi:hypothetical protein
MRRYGSMCGVCCGRSLLCLRCGSSRQQQMMQQQLRRPCSKMTSSSSSSRQGQAVLVPMCLWQQCRGYQAVKLRALALSPAAHLGRQMLLLLLHLLLPALG